MPRKDALIDLLLAKKMVTQAQVDKAGEEMKKTGLPIEKTLETMGYLRKEDIINVMSESTKTAYVDIKDYIIDPETINLIPESIARKYIILPLFKVGDTLTIATANPRDIIALDDIKLKTKIPVLEPVLAAEEAIRRAIDQYYAVKGDIDEILRGMDSLAASSPDQMDDAKTLEKASEEVPVVKLVNHIITQAIKDKASDIHVEPEEKLVRIRLRIDGIMRETMTLPKNLRTLIASRIKILAKMDISESRKPQDGRIELKFQNKEIDLRVSTFPTIHGENIVARILDKTSVIFGLADMGFSKKDLADFERLIRMPYGIVLVTGPTGSGKTTTLYAALTAVNSIEKNIITVEDPVEYQIPLIRQTQVNPKAGLTFATGLRSILRQDPDIVMVGEVRDKETADIAVQASLTGHLVLSTLHTNDAPSAVTRLVDMGVEPFLVSSSLIGVIAQRLVRVICKGCKEKYVPEPELLRELKIKKDAVFHKGKGCDDCKHTGYLGRIGIFEFMRMSDEIRKLILQKASSDDIRDAAVKDGMRTLRDDGLDKAARGITTIEEVVRVTD